MLLGVLALGEPVTAGLLVGFPLVLLGSYLATRRSAPVSPEAAAGAVVTPDEAESGLHQEAGSRAGPGRR